jgi:hypothetical protein
LIVSLLLVIKLFVFFFGSRLPPRRLFLDGKRALDGSGGFASEDVGVGEPGEAEGGSWGGDDVDVDRVCVCDECWSWLEGRKRGGGKCTGELGKGQGKEA